MREIKFRAWNKLEGERKMWYFALNERNLNVPFLVENLKIMQFTGCLDKNEKEIYEGSILEADERIEGRLFKRVRGEV